MTFVSPLLLSGTHSIVVPRAFCQKKEAWEGNVLSEAPPSTFDFSPSLSPAPHHRSLPPLPSTPLSTLKPPSSPSKPLRSTFEATRSPRPFDPSPPPSPGEGRRGRGGVFGGSLEGGPEGWGAEGWEGPKFRVFFPSPTTNFALFCLFLGLLVEFRWCLEFSGCRVKPRRPHPSSDHIAWCQGVCRTIFEWVRRVDRDREEEPHPLVEPPRRRLEGAMVAVDDSDAALSLSCRASCCPTVE